MWEALASALHRLATFDPDLWSAVGVSVQVSLAALLLAALAGIPLAYLLAVFDFPGRRTLRSAFAAMLSVPTVVVGLLVFALLSRNGPLGPLDLLFSPTAMTLAEAVLVLPLVVTLMAAALEQVDRQLGEELWSLGVRGTQRLALTLNEARGALAAALITGLGRALSEVGCAMMVGGNIRGYTRNITTAIALETSMGEFSLSLGLGMLLLALALGLNVLVGLLAEKGKKPWTSS